LLTYADTTTVMPTTKTGNSYKYDKSCSHAQFGEFKHLLMIYHCNRLGIAKCDSQSKWLFITWH